MRLMSSIAGMAIVAAVSAEVCADSVVVISGRDNTLYQDSNGALSNGAGEFFFAGNTGTGVIRRGLVNFDVAGAVPARSTINSASLILHMSMTSTGATSVGLHRVLAAWGEGSSDAAGGEGAGAPATAGDATWIHTFFNSSLWAGAGGDFDATASASTSVSAVGFYSWNSASLTNDVQNWLYTPSLNSG